MYEFTAFFFKGITLTREVETLAEAEALEDLFQRGFTATLVATAIRKIG